VGDRLTPATDDDDAVDGGNVFLDAIPITAAAPVLITLPGSDGGQPLESQTDDLEHSTAATDCSVSSGNCVIGLARSTSDVTSQRRFRRRRSAARCSTALAPRTPTQSPYHVLNPCSAPKLLTLKSALKDLFST